MVWPSITTASPTAPRPVCRMVVDSFWRAMIHNRLVSCRRWSSLWVYGHGFGLHFSRPNSCFNCGVETDTGLIRDIISMYYYYFFFAFFICFGVLPWKFARFYAFSASQHCQPASAIGILTSTSYHYPSVPILPPLTVHLFCPARQQHPPYRLKWIGFRHRKMETRKQ